MKQIQWFIVVVLVLGFFAAPTEVYASLDQAAGTVVEGVVEFPVGLVKLVGGLVWTVGEVIALPFRLIF